MNKQEDADKKRGGSDEPLADPTKIPRIEGPPMVQTSFADQLRGFTSEQADMVATRDAQIAQQQSAEMQSNNSVSSSSANDGVNNLSKDELLKLVGSLTTQCANLSNQMSSVMQLVGTLTSHQLSAASHDPDQKRQAFEMEARRLQLEEERTARELEAQRVREVDRIKREEEAAKKEKDRRDKQQLEKIPDPVIADLKRIVEKAGRLQKKHVKASGIIRKVTDVCDDLSSGRIPPGIPRYTPAWDWGELDAIWSVTNDGDYKIEFTMPRMITRREAIRKLNCEFLWRVKTIEKEAAEEMKKQAALYSSLDSIKEKVDALEFSTQASSSSNQSKDSMCLDRAIWKMKAEQLWHAKLALVERDLLKEEQSRADKQKKDSENKQRLNDKKPDVLLKSLVSTVVQDYLQDYLRVMGLQASDLSGDAPMTDQDPELAAIEEARDAAQAAAKKDADNKKFAETTAAFVGCVSPSPPRDRGHGRGRGRGKGRGKGRGRSRGVSSFAKSVAKGPGKGKTKNGQSPGHGGHNRHGSLPKGKGKGKPGAKGGGKKGGKY